MVSVKLADKMKALDKLSQYFDLVPDNFKRKIEEERHKIQMEVQKLKLIKLKQILLALKVMKVKSMKMMDLSMH